MNTLKKRITRYATFVVTASLLLLGTVAAQPFPVGDIADNFTLLNRRTGEIVALSDFEGQVVVLDFFAYWCAPCAFSSPDIEQNIQEFYEAQGGNANGVPVQVLSVNIESESPEKTDLFIEQADLDLVIDDTSGVVWDLFNKTNGIPLFAVINGVANSPSHDQWEVLHNEPSYPGSDFLKELIDSVEEGVVVDPIETAVELGDNWRWIEWFGSFQAESLPWIFHEVHGWMNMGEGNLNTGQFIWDSTIGWVWISKEYYPSIFSFDRNSWIRFEEGTVNSRTFFDYNLNGTVEFKNKSPQDLVFNGFNLEDMSVPLAFVASGGPPRDGIPSLTNPKFVSISQADFMQNSDILLSVTVNGETRGYPYRILNWHEVVNDQIGDDAFVVTYCPLCGTGVVFDAMVNGRKRDFGVSGLLFQNNVLMYDRETLSLWSQFMLQSVSGSMKASKLKWRRSEQITWADWKAKYPNGKVLSTDTGHTRFYDLNPYADYFEGDGPRFRTGNPIRSDFPEMEWVWGITVGDVAKAYAVERLTDGVPFRDTVNGVELELVADRAALSVTVTVVETGEFLDNGLGNLWFSWQDFFPETLVYK